MNTVFDPSILFISDNFWKEHYKDCQKQLLDYIRFIKEHKFTKVYLTLELQKFFWEPPTPHPWRRDKTSISDGLIEQYYELFKIIETIPQNELHCDIKPELKFSINNIKIFECFLKLLHQVIHSNEIFYLCLGLENQYNDYCIKCDCHLNNKELKPICITNSSKWLCHLNPNDLLIIKEARLKKLTNKVIKNKNKVINTDVSGTGTHKSIWKKKITKLTDIPDCSARKLFKLLVDTGYVKSIKFLDFPANKLPAVDPPFLKIINTSVKVDSYVINCMFMGKGKIGNSQNITINFIENMGKEFREVFLDNKIKIDDLEKLF